MDPQAEPVLEPENNEAATHEPAAAAETVAEDAAPAAEAQAEEAPAEEAPAEEEASLPEEISADELLPETESDVEQMPMGDAQLKAVLEAIIYVTDEPLTLEQICVAIEQPEARVIELLEQLAAEYERPDRGLMIREVAGGFRMSTKPEHHDAVRRFVRNLNPPLKLSLPALETLAVIAYKQPVTAPEIMEIRGVQGAGVLKTLLDRKLIAVAGRKQVIGKPILYKTTKEFLVQFGLRDLNELPTLKEFQEIGRMDTEGPGPDAIDTTGPAASGHAAEVIEMPSHGLFEESEAAEAVEEAAPEAAEAEAASAETTEAPEAESQS